MIDLASLVPRLRILVTGATGFVGTHVVQVAAKHGHDVHAVARRAPVSPVPGVEYHSLDLIEDRAAVRRVIEQVRPTHLLHLAWYAEPSLYWSSIENFRWVAGSLDLADAFAKAGGKRLVVAGSCAEYEWGQEVLDEATTPCRPSTVYGFAKNSLREMLERWSALSHVPVAWGRVFFTFGPHEPAARLVPSLIRSLLKGEPWPCSEGYQRRDFSYITDVAAALVALAESSEEGPLNIGSGNAIAVRDIVSEIGRQVGRPDLIRFGALPGRDEPGLIQADIRRLNRIFDTRSRMDLKAGIAYTVEWWSRANIH